MLQHIAARLAGRDVRRVGRIRRNRREQIGILAGHGRLELGREVRIRCLPSVVTFVPLGASCTEVGRVLGEVVADLGRDEELLLRQPEPGARRRGERHPALAVRLAGARHLGDALADERLRDDELRLAGRGAGLLECLVELLQVLPVHLLDIPAVGLVARPRVLALREQGHRVEGHVVGVVDEDEVVELQVSGQRTRLARDALLQAAVTGETDDFVVENGVRRGVEARGRHLAGHGETHGIGHALAERPGRALDARCFVKLGMARRDAAELAEALHFVQRNAVAGEVQPPVEEHAAVPRGEDEPVAIQPAGLSRVVAKRVAEEHSADLRTAERQAEVTGFAGGYGVNGEPARVAGGGGQNFVGERHKAVNVATARPDRQANSGILMQVIEAWANLCRS